MFFRLHPVKRRNGLRQLWQHSNVALETLPAIARRTNEYLCKLENHPLKSFASLGRVIKFQNATKRRIDVSRNLDLEIQSAFNQVIKLRHWFSNKKVLESTVYLINRDWGQILIMKVQLDQVFTSDHVPTATEQEEIDKLIHNVVKKIFDCNLDFGMKLDKLYPPVIKYYQTDDSTNYVQATLKLQTLQLTKPNCNVQTISKKFQNLHKLASSRTTSRLASYGCLNKTSSGVSQQIILSKVLQARICNRIKQTIINRGKVKILGGKPMASATILQVGEESRVSIKTNVFLEKYTLKHPSIYYKRDLSEMSNYAVRSIFEGLKGTGIELDEIYTLHAIVAENSPVTITSKLRIAFAEDYLTPNDSALIFPEVNEAVLHKRRKLDQDSKQRDHKGFRFVNFDKLQGIGAASYKDAEPKQPSSTMILTDWNSEGRGYRPVLGLSPLTVTSVAGKNFKNPTNREAIELIGYLILRELLFKWAMTNLKIKPIDIVKGFLASVRSTKLMEQSTAGYTKLDLIHAVQAYVGLKYLEENTIDGIAKWYKTRLETRDLNFYFDKDTWITKQKPELESLCRSHIAGPLDLTLFSQVNQPTLLRYLPHKLPPIPRLTNDFLYSFIRLSFSHPFHNNKYPKVNYFKKSLDGLGDAILKRISCEYFMNVLKTDPTFKWNMDDIHFINTNILFGRLAIAYRLHEGIQNEEYSAFIKNRLLGSLDSANVFLGNHFETLVSVLYLDSPETCTKWMFKVYDAVRNNLTASNGKETFLDKEKYIRLYEHQLKTHTLY